MSSRKLALTFFFLAFAFQTVAQKKIAKSKDYVITITTAYGDMVALLSDKAPLHKANFVKLAQSGFYDSTTFHRVISGFMIQGGDSLSKDKDPANDGTGSNGYTIAAELNNGLQHKRGAIAAARLGDQVNPLRASNGSQFYIVLDDKGAVHLDGAYTVFGQIVSGVDVIDKIAAQATNNRNRPLENIYMVMKVEAMKRSKIIKKYNVQSFYEVK